MALLSPRHAVRTPFILYTSRIEHPGKNHARLIRAFAELKRRDRIPHQLVLAGADRERAEEVHRTAEGSGFAKDIPFHGFVATEDLPPAVPGCRHLRLSFALLIALGFDPEAHGLRHAGRLLQDFVHAGSGG